MAIKKKEGYCISYDSLTLISRRKEAVSDVVIEDGPIVDHSPFTNFYLFK